MNVDEAKEVLRKHNEWRREDFDGMSDSNMQNPVLIGIAIDVLVNHMDCKCHNGD